MEIRRLILELDPHKAYRLHDIPSFLHKESIETHDMLLAGMVQKFNYAEKNTNYEIIK